MERVEMERGGHRVCSLDHLRLIVWRQPQGGKPVWKSRVDSTLHGSVCGIPNGTPTLGRDLLLSNRETVRVTEKIPRCAILNTDWFVFDRQRENRGYHPGKNGTTQDTGEHLWPTPDPRSRPFVRSVYGTDK